MPEPAIDDQDLWAVMAWYGVSCEIGRAGGMIMALVVAIAVAVEAPTVHALFLLAPRSDRESALASPDRRLAQSALSLAGEKQAHWLAANAAKRRAGRAQSAAGRRCNGGSPVATGAGTPLVRLPTGLQSTPAKSMIHWARAARPADDAANAQQDQHDARQQCHRQARIRVEQDAARDQRGTAAQDARRAIDWPNVLLPPPHVRSVGLQAYDEQVRQVIHDLGFHARVSFDFQAYALP